MQSHNEIAQTAKKNSGREGEPLRAVLPAGTLVRFYDNGWRIGYVMKWGRKVAIIKSANRFNPRKHKVDINDIQKWSDV